MSKVLNLHLCENAKDETVVIQNLIINDKVANRTRCYYCQDFTDLTDESTLIICKACQCKDIVKSVEKKITAMANESNRCCKFCLACGENYDERRHKLDKYRICYD